MRTFRALIVLTVLSLGAILAPAAFADTLVLTHSGTSTPEEGLAFDVTFSGSTGAVDANGDGQYLYALDRPADGTPCQASFGADQNLEGDNSDVLEEGTALDASSPFTQTDEITPDLGGGLICAWIETDPEDGIDTVSADQVTAGPMTASFTASAPQVSPIKVTVGAHPSPGADYTITYRTTTDQDLTLDSIVIPAAAGPCAGTYEDQLDATPDAPDVLDGGADISGPTVTHATDAETTPGRYLVCSWIEGPDDLQVDAHTSTPVTIGTTTGAGGTSGTGATDSGSTGNGTTAGRAGGVCLVPRLNGLTRSAAEARLRAAGCGVGAIRRESGRRARSGRVLGQSAAAGRRLKAGTRVGLTLGRG